MAPAVRKGKTQAPIGNDDFLKGCPMGDESTSNSRCRCVPGCRRVGLGDSEAPDKAAMLRQQILDHRKQMSDQDVETRVAKLMEWALCKKHLAIINQAVETAVRQMKEKDGIFDETSLVTPGFRPTARSTSSQAYVEDEDVVYTGRRTRNSRAAQATATPTTAYHAMPRQQAATPPYSPRSSISAASSRTLSASGTPTPVQPATTERHMSMVNVFQGAPALRASRPATRSSTAGNAFHTASTSQASLRTPSVSSAGSHASVYTPSVSSNGSSLRQNLATGATRTVRQPIIRGEIDQMIANLARLELRNAMLLDQVKLLQAGKADAEARATKAEEYNDELRDYATQLEAENDALRDPVYGIE